MILQKYLRDNLNISRRDAESAILAGKVAVNDKPAKPGQLLDLEKDVVVYNQTTVTPSIKKLIYIALNKPAGYITSRGDPHGRKTIYALLPKEFSNLVPVGRLDYETEGLLLLTNDGDLTYQLTHPKYEVEKEYYVELDKPLNSKDKTVIESGIRSKDLNTSPCTISFVDGSGDKISIIVHEGQNREIRRIFEHFGYSVTYLKRTRIGNLVLASLNLSVGSWAKIDKSMI